MLTVKQLLAITTRRSVPPWRVRDLLTVFTLKEISLRSIISGVQGQNVVFFVKVQDASLLKSVKNLEELQALFAKSVPTKTTWGQLAKILSAFGGFKFLSNNWMTVGIAGTVDAFVGVPTLGITNDPNIWEFLGGAGAAGAVLMAIGAATADPLIFYVGVGIASSSAGAVAGDGLFGMTHDDTTVTTYGQSPPDPGTGLILPDLSAYGPIPAGVNPQDVGNAQTIDPSTLPDVPPEPEPPPDPGPPPGP
jgi:hypothetical protein